MPMSVSPACASSNHGQCPGYYMTAAPCTCNCHTPKKGDVHARLAAVMAAVRSVPKDATNAGQGWAYRSIDAMLAAVHPPLAANGLVFAPEVLEHTYEVMGGKTWVATVKVCYRALAADGSQVVAGTVVATGHDTYDKAMTKAMTYAFKTFLGQLFALAEIEDPDADSVEAGGVRSASGERTHGTSGKVGSKDNAPRARGKATRNLPIPDDEPRLPRDQAIAVKAKELGLSEAEMRECIGIVTDGRTSSGKDLRPGEGSMVFAEMEHMAKEKAT